MWEERREGGSFACLLGELADAVGHVLVRGVVDENVDSAQVRDRLVDDLLACLLGPQVGRAEEALPPPFLHLPLRLLRVVLLFGQVVDQRVCAFHGVQDGDGAADAAVPAGDEGLLAFELAGGLVGLVAAVFGGHVFADGSWPFHLRLTAGLLLVVDWDLVACIFCQCWRLGGRRRR